MKERTILSIRTITAILWLGFHMSLSFMDAPLKYTPAGIPVETGLAIGQIVFDKHIKCELVLMLILIGTFCIRGTIMGGWQGLALITAIMLVETTWLWPALNQRTIRIMASEPDGPDYVHWLFIVLEAIKIPVLLGIGWYSLKMRDNQ